MEKNGNENSVAVGLDIGRHYVQLSCMPFPSGEVQTISTRMGNEQYEIPLTLFLTQNVDEWKYGEAAAGCRDDETGIYVDELWMGVLSHRELVMENRTSSYEELMAVYLDKVLALVRQSGYAGRIETLVITAETMDQKTIRHLQTIRELLSVDVDNVYYIDYKESFYAYATSMKKELWNHEVFLFYYCDRNLRAYRLNVSQKRLPFQVRTEEMDYGTMEYSGEELADSGQAGEEMDARFLATLEELFARRVVSGVYLIGDGFMSGWMKQSLRFMCRGRRVFQGNNLFTKGACYAGAIYRGQRKPAGEYIGSQSLACDVRFGMIHKGENEYRYVAEKGEPWYRAGVMLECLYNEADCVELELMFDNRQVPDRFVRLELEHFPKRPTGASRVRMTIYFTDAMTGKVIVEDLGLGEFYASSGMKWEKSFALTKEEI